MTALARLSARLRPWRSRLAVLTVFAVAVALLLGPSLTGARVALPHDLQMERLPWRAVADGRVQPANPELRDLIDVYYPVQHHLVEQMRARKSPTWIGDVSFGMPGAWFIGWGAVSPFTLLGLFLPFDLAWSYGMALRLVTAMGGAYLLARSLGVRRAGATVAGLSFGLSGYMIGWLGWPQTHVGAFVPWMWWGVRRAAGPAAPRWAGPAAAVATAGVWLGGFPAVSAYAVVATLPVALHAAAARAGWWRRLRGVAVAALAVALGTTLAAFTLVPSVAFLDQLALGAREGAWQNQLSAVALWLFVAPGMFGDVVHEPWLLRGAYVESIGYAGVVTLALALPAWLIAPRRRGVGLFTLLGVLYAALAFGADPLQRLVALVPALRMNSPTRTLALVGLCIAIVGGLGADALVRFARREARLPRLAAGFGAAALAMFTAPLATALDALEPAVRSRAPAAIEAGAVANAQRHVTLAFVLVSIASAAALLGTVVARWRPSGGARVVGAGLVAVVALDLVIFATGWNVQAPRERLFPDAPGLDALSRYSEDHRVAGADAVGHPNTHLEYAFRDARAHTFVSDRQQEILTRLGVDWLSPTRWDLDTVDSSDWQPWLSLLGVKAVLAPRAAQTLPGVTRVGVAAQEPLGPLTQGQPRLSQAVTAPRTAALRGVLFRVGTYGRVNSGELVVEVTARGERRAGRVRVAGVRDNAWVHVPIRELDVREGDLVRVHVSGTALDPSRAVTVWGEDAGAHPEPALALALGPGWPSQDLGPVRLFRNPWARPLVHAARRAVRVGPGEALDVIAAAGVDDLLTTTFVEAPPGTRLPAGSGRATVSSWQRDGGVRRASVSSDHGAVLVLADHPAPGWEAQVDGRSATVFVADHVFLGVAVPPGDHRVVVRYVPPGLREGTLASLAAAAAVLVWMLLAAWPRRQHAEDDSAARTGWLDEPQRGDVEEREGASA